MLAVLFGAGFLNALAQRDGLHKSGGNFYNCIVRNKIGL